MIGFRFGRRHFLKASAAASAAAAVGPYVRTSRAAGSLRVGFWDHVMPGANAALTKLCTEWAKKEKVDLKVDYISTLMLTIPSEAQAKKGHDVLALPAWYVPAQAANLEPVDDIMQPLISHNGDVIPTVEHLGRQNGQWIAVPATPGTQLRPPCARIDLLREHVGLDITRMYPPGAPPDKMLAQQWNWDTFLAAAEKCFKAGYGFGLGLGETPDSIDWTGALFASYGAELVGSTGNVTVNSDATKQVLEYMKRLVPLLPSDVFAWDDFSNNKWLVAGKGALIMNAPSAWAVAKRDNPKVAEQLWTFPSPKGPKGRYQPLAASFWGIWKFSSNKAAAKSLLMHLSQRSSVEQLVAASGGYDIPGFSGLRNLNIWAEAGPPKGTLYHYPPAPDQILWISGLPAPAPVASQIYTHATITKMIAKYAQRGEPMDKTIAWATSQLEGFLALAGFAAPAKTASQQRGKIYRIAYLTPFALEFERAGIDVFEQTLLEQGYMQGQNASITYRSSEGKDERLPELATQLLQLDVDVLVTLGTPATRAAQRATDTVPIVMVTVLDPVRAGFVASLAHPGGNITGSSDLSEELTAKRVELLKQAIPTASLIAVLWDPTHSANALDLERTRTAAEALGLRIRPVAVRDRSEIDKAFADMRRWRPQALMVLTSSTALVHLARIMELAKESRLPSMYGVRAGALAGALLSYGPDLADQYRHAAAFVGKILAGAKPADLPVEQPTRFELVINLVTAKALGVTVPQSLLVSADEVIK